MRIALFVATIALLQGCSGNFHSIYRKDTLGKVDIVSADAKQRFLFASEVGPPDAAGHRRLIVCPEPSPDALSATGFTGKMSAQQAGGIAGLGLGGAGAENTGSVGLRTQTISLLRDQMTHLCLLRMSNALDDNTYTEQLRRLQISALGMLAIEQLTAPTVAPAIAIGVSAQQSPPSGNDEAKNEAIPTIGKLSITPSTQIDGAPDRTPGHSVHVTNAVVDIVRTVLDVGFFDIDRCMRDLNNAKQHLGSDVAKLRAPPSCLKAEQATDKDEVVRTLLGGIDLNKAQMQALVRDMFPDGIRLVSPVTRTLVDALPATEKPYQGYGVGVFVCKRASPQYIEDIRKVVDADIRPKTLGTVRLTVLDDEPFRLRSAGLDPSRSVAVAFYDEDNATEASVASSIATSLQKVRAPGTETITALPNAARQKATPYYISAWLCP